MSRPAPGAPCSAGPGGPSGPSGASPAANVAVVAGTLARPATVRPLAGGDVLELDVTVRLVGLPTETVPVTLADPPPALVGLLEGDPVIVVGRVRRRFFRSGGATASRTEVVATDVLPARRKAAAAKAVAGALAALGELA